jgi:antitoxin component of MazEF toxin-antitoxin module
MPSNVNLRDRRQITLPAEIVAAAGLSTDDQLEVRWQNGAIVMVPTRAAQQPARSMAKYQGAAKGLYGATEAEANSYVRDQRDAW